jgi:hypothetical protein
MTGDLIRLRGRFGQSEVNCGGALYAVSRWGTVCVPEADVVPLLRTGGFHLAREDDKGADHSLLSDVAEVIWHLETGKVRSTLLMLCENTNALNYVIQTQPKAII